ncbi:hypothetical protein E0H50_14840 [Kribbella sindirgiensis]|uniref:Uncharacterized protein n=1 Tax=Kribbella sindirgiensis TaxID=1124744 RepID=A0A4R0IQ72_9ACTN|nr:hypothetical protein E0H50_14840 [Kribbella sindirgiensis]
MSHPDPPLGPTVLGKTEILSYLSEVADELAVVREVGERHGLRASWLNDGVPIRRARPVPR